MKYTSPADSSSIHRPGYRALFTAAIGFALGTALWGLVLAPFNSFNDHRARSVGIGLVLAGLFGLAWRYRTVLYVRLRGQSDWLVVIAVVGVAALWLDGGWRSTFYLVSYVAVVIAAVVAGVRWALVCAAITAAHAQTA